MTRETVEKILRDAIEDERRLPQEFHLGRVHALRFALELVEEIETCVDRAITANSVPPGEAVAISAIQNDLQTEGGHHVDV